MKVVEFHHGIGDKLAYACRLVRKAWRSGATMVVTGDAATLRQLDRQLWVFDEQEFIPHVSVLGGQAWPERWEGTPVWLTDQPKAVPQGLSVLINLGAEVPDGIGAFERFFEVVSTQEDDRRLGRARWRQYESLGWTVQGHVAQEGRA